MGPEAPCTRKRTDLTIFARVERTPLRCARGRRVRADCTAPSGLGRLRALLGIVLPRGQLTLPRIGPTGRVAWPGRSSRPSDGHCRPSDSEGERAAAGVVTLPLPLAVPVAEPQPVPLVVAGLPRLSGLSVGAAQGAPAVRPGRGGGRR